MIKFTCDKCRKSKYDDEHYCADCFVDLMGERDELIDNVKDLEKQIEDLINQLLDKGV